MCGPLLQLTQHLDLSFVKQCGHCKEVFLKTVDERNWELVIHNLFLSNHNESVKTTSLFQEAKTVFWPSDITQWN